MKLYEITENYRLLFDSFDDCDELSDDEIQAYFDTLEAIEGDFSVKAENIACFIKELNGEVDMLAAELRSLKARKSAKENLAERLKQMLIDNMQSTGIKKIDRPHAKLSLRNNAESVICDIGDKAFEKWAIENDVKDILKFKPELSKTALKEELKNGREFPGVHLGRTVSVVIK